MNTTTTSKTTVASTPAGTTRDLARVSAIAGVVAAAATLAVAAVAQALDVSLEARGEPIPLLGFPQVTLMATLIGFVLAKVLSRRARHPQHTFVVTTLGLTVLSFVPSLMIEADAATKAVLVLTHLVAAAIVIPAIASRLAK